MSVEEGFNDFWYRYPRRVGKLAARAAYERALKLTTHEELMAGMERYIKTKPAWQAWAHPRTWLSQGRWMDDVPAPRPIGGIGGATCPHAPRCATITACIRLTLAQNREAKPA